MNQSLMLLGLGLCLAWPAPVAQAAGTETVQLKGHVPAVVARLPDKGRLAATNLTLSIGLPLRNREALTNLLRQINDPKSSIYHQYLTAAQFASLFGPSEQDYLAVADFARAHGLKVTAPQANHMLLNVSGRSTDIEKAFNVTLKTYKHPTENRDFFAPDTEPSVPAGLKVLDITGLSNYGRPRNHLRLGTAHSPANPALQPSAKGTPQNGSGPGGNYMGDDFRNAYIPGSALNGSGQAVAEVEFDGYYASDIQEYEQLTGRNNIPLQNTYLDGFNGAPTGNGGEVEVSLDIEMLVSMAPALAKIIVYEGNPDNFIPNDVLGQIAADDSARQISCSWGWEGLPTGTTDQIFQQMALQGQTFYTASGDSDAFPVGTLVFTPSDDPYVTSVGGTTLNMDPRATRRISETVWNWDVEYGSIEDGVGSSGGISLSYLIPYWQTNVNMTAAQGSTIYRNFPDVALTADNVLVIADGGVEYLGTGGTSCAAPLWAGFTAMINQQESVFNNAPIGFINPALYNLARTTSYATCFNDITTGSNTWSASPNLFIAVPNYDLCTGLGTPNGTNLINALVSGPVFAFQVSPPPAPYGFALTNVIGGTPDGPWSLFIQDNDVISSGILNNGWSIALTLGSPVGADADLNLTLSALATNIWPGSNLVFYITVTNVGNMSIATNVVVADTLPADVFYVSSSSTLPASTITRDGTQVIWQMGNLVPNAGGQLTITAQSANATENIFDYAVVTEATPDPNPDDNSKILALNVAVPPPPQLTGSFTRTNGYFTLNVTGFSGSTLIQASTNLLSTNWVTIFTTNGPSFIYTDSRKTNYPARFFRAVAGP